MLLLPYNLARRCQRRLQMSAAIFAVHPIHTEAVDWIAALPDVLLTTLALAGMLAFVRQSGLPNRLQTRGALRHIFAGATHQRDGRHAAAVVCRIRMDRASVVRRRRCAANVWLYAGMAAAFRNLFSDAGPRVGWTGARAAGVSPTASHRTRDERGRNRRELFCRLVWLAGLNFFHIFHATMPGRLRNSSCL